MISEHSSDTGGYFQSVRPFEPEGPSRFFDLPIEIRYMTLELLLVRGKVALAQDSAIKRRFPDWDHERPEWGKSIFEWDGHQRRLADLRNPSLALRCQPPDAEGGF